MLRCPDAVSLPGCGCGCRRWKVEGWEVEGWGARGGLATRRVQAPPFWIDVSTVAALHSCDASSGTRIRAQKRLTFERSNAGRMARHARHDVLRPRHAETEIASSRRRGRLPAVYREARAGAGLLFLKSTEALRGGIGGGRGRQNGGTRRSHRSITRMSFIDRWISRSQVRTLLTGEACVSQYSAWIRGRRVGLPGRSCAGGREGMPRGAAALPQHRRNPCPRVANPRHAAHGAVARRGVRPSRHPRCP